MASARTSGVKSVLGLAGWVLLSFGASASGAFFSPGEWYAALDKPSFNPPGWVFGPVWTALYLMMGVSAWLVWRRGNAWRALALWLVQLALNAAWTPFFFGLHWMGVALCIIIAMWLAILATILAFRRHARAAALLLVPYLLWVSFATVLNAALWHLN
ncbi:MAG: tryptophan-rich sensory protein [Planctomycetes bacterium]|nr:tryptophan-rich sensory protein [Planctomycetota bacterium]MCW8136692.1 tryptophan-rich sensory protein [Planctomycetota bacterium]